MKAVAGLVYKFAIPRNCVRDNLNLAAYINVGGAKTAAGIDRTVTVSPVIQPMIDRLVSGRSSGFVFCDIAPGGELSARSYRQFFILF